MSDVEKAISDVRGRGFWSVATERRLRQVVAKLRSAGVSEQIIAETIRDFWLMVSAEYDE